MDKVELIRQEIERLKESGCASHIVICDTLLAFIDSLQEEPVSIWHNANQQPTMYRKYLVRYSDDRVSGSWERHDDGFIPWKDVVKEHGFTHWCYVEDLLKL